MPQLRIIFTGLCAGGPPGPKPGEEPVPAEGPYQVVMPASHPKRARRSPHYTIPVHLPFLAARRIDLTDPVSPSRRLESCRVPNGRNEQCYVWLLSREHITFSTVGAEWAPGKIQYTKTNMTPEDRPKVDLSSGRSDERDVTWIPDMRLIWPEAAKLRAGCLPPGKDPNVAVQVTINSGTLSSRFPKYLALQERTTRFDPVKATPVERAITRQALFTADLPAGTRRVQINCHAIDTGEELGPIELEVGDDGVDLLIGNTDLDDLLQTVRGLQTESEYDIDSDFELYYDILDLPSQTVAAASATSDDPSDDREPAKGEPPPPSPPPELPIPIPDPHHGGHGDCPTLRVQTTGGTP